MSKKRELLKKCLDANCLYGDLHEEIEAELAKPELIEEGQIGESLGADFETRRWIFEMPEGLKVGPGKYKITRVKS